MPYLKLRLVPGALVLTCALTHGADDTEHVLVTAPLHKTAAETAMPVTVLSGDELRNKAANNIGDTLQFEPGIASASFGPGVGQPVIRGHVGARTAVIQNGVAIEDAASTSADHANATEVLVAESIEVIRGPATLLYGSGAVGGVVNVIDNRIPSMIPAGLELGLEYRHNTVNDQNTGVVVVDAGSDSVAVHFDGFYRESNDVRIPGDALAAPQAGDASNGFIGNSNTLAKGATAGASWVSDWGYVGASASRLEDNYGLPPGVHEDHDHEGAATDDEQALIRLDLVQNRYDLKTAIYHPASWLEAMRFHLVRSDYEHVELEGQQVGTRFTSDAWNFRGELVHHAVAGWHGAVGMDYSRRNFSAIGEEAFIPETDTDKAGLFLLEDFHTDAWTVELGLRLGYQRIDPVDNAVAARSHKPVSLSASGLWSVSDSDKLSFSLSRSQRAPTVEELYSNAGNLTSGDLVEHAASGSVEIGDIDLDLETSANLEFGWRHSGSVFSAGINLFYNRFKDYTYLQNSGLVYNPDECAPLVVCGPGQADEGPPVLFYEQQAATFRGLELDFNFPLINQGVHDLNIDLFGDIVRATLDDSNDDVPRMPPARIGAQLNYSVSQWSTLLRVHHGASQDNPGANESSTAAWTRLDAAVSYRLPVAHGQLTLFAKGNNLTNAEIRNSSSFLRDYAPEPGRGFELGVRYEM